MVTTPDVIFIEENESALNLFNAISDPIETNTYPGLNLVIQRAIEFLRDNKYITEVLLSHYSGVLERVKRFGIGFNEFANSERTEYRAAPINIDAVLFAAIVFNMGKDKGMEVKMTSGLPSQTIELTTFRLCISKDRIDVFEE